MACYSAVENNDIIKFAIKYLERGKNTWKVFFGNTWKDDKYLERQT